MAIPKEEQNEFARAIVGIVDANERNPEILGHLCKLSSLLIYWTEEGNGDTAIDLGEYLYELNDFVVNGGDADLADEFKKALYYDIGYEDRLEK